ncbi:hypothetical protein OPT61_g6235 [Boeremia exigua]|uniref:Uncharacterized protein n=1 Tax=Boeremia exigua TaxID=749465 RepID=A0ACC2I7C6_9PLEO|nr:hypothetical protein OPT61_g6235 [Boeremia exigua]
MNAEQSLGDGPTKRPPQMTAAPGSVDEAIRSSNSADGPWWGEEDNTVEPEYETGEAMGIENGGRTLVSNSLELKK